jgi:hypothetical protein
LNGNGSTAFLQNRDEALANVTLQVIENKRKLGLYWAVKVVGDGTADVCYALAQCHGYLPPSDCTYCLGLAWNDLKTMPGISPGGGRFNRGGSCYFRYENYAIYSNNLPSIQISLGPSPQPGPLPSPTGFPPSGAHSLLPSFYTLSSTVLVLSNGFFFFYKAVELCFRL